MKILLVNKFFFRNGGAEAVFFNERKMLKENGHTVIDFSMVDERNYASPYTSYFAPNVNYSEFSNFSSRLKQAISFIHSTEAVSRFSDLMTNVSPHIVHFHNIYHQLTPSIISVARKNKAKTILTLHDYKLICPGYRMLNRNRICDRCYPNRFLQPLFTNCQGSIRNSLVLSAEFLWHFWKRSYDHIDIFISPSRFLASAIGRRIPPRKIRVVTNGIDVNSYPEQSGDKGYALYFGRISEEKGLPTLLRAHRILSNRLDLIIAGTGPIEDHLRNTFPQANFYGYTSGAELVRLIADAAFVVVPSEYYENCSMAVLEAMACEKPVIASRIGGLPEQIEHGKTGFLFKKGNVAELVHYMDVLSSNPQFRHQMGRAARHKCKSEYSQDRHFSDIARIIDQLVEPGAAHDA